MGEQGTPYSFSNRPQTVFAIENMGKKEVHQCIANLSFYCATTTNDYCTVCVVTTATHHHRIILYTTFNSTIYRFDKAHLHDLTGYLSGSPIM